MLVFFSLGHDVREKSIWVGQTIIPIGHCPMTDAYLQPWMSIHSNVITFKTLRKRREKKENIAQSHSNDNRIVYTGVVVLFLFSVNK